MEDPQTTYTDVFSFCFFASKKIKKDPITLQQKKN